MNSAANTEIIVLAAGLGKRLQPLTQYIPKCMVEFNNRTLLDHQIAIYKDLGFNKINIVVGHGSQHVASKNIELNKLLNQDFDSTNMMYSLSKSFDIFDGTQDIIVVYGDIIFKKSVFQSILNMQDPISVITDLNWYRYWQMRCEDVLSDAETFKWNTDTKQVYEIGKKALSLDDIQGQYIGMFKINKAFASEFKNMYLRLNQSETSTRNMFITDFLQYIIDSKYKVMACPINNGWLEFDSMTDFNIYNDLLQKKNLRDFYEYS